ncbi:hypothetical protein [Streptomyces swartbergensis]|uniref:hypothetical protein n=1 Tax=Streptomyces swartbergensis TaxID=487165 RepID=UPI003817226D
MIRWLSPRLMRCVGASGPPLTPRRRPAGRSGSAGRGALRRAEDLLDLAQARKLDASVLVEADAPHVWRMLCGRSPAAVRQVDAWMARALAARCGALAD